MIFKYFRVDLYLFDHFRSKSLRPAVIFKYNESQMFSKFEVNRDYSRNRQEIRTFLQSAVLNIPMVKFSTKLQAPYKIIISEYKSKMKSPWPQLNSEKKKFKTRVVFAGKIIICGGKKIINYYFTVGGNKVRNIVCKRSPWPQTDIEKEILDSDSNYLGKIGSFEVEKKVKIYFTVGEKIFKAGWKESRKKLNKLKHAEEGNKKQDRFQLRTYFINIPGMIQRMSVESAIMNIVYDARPDILYVGEVDAKLLSGVVIDGYDFVPGMNQNLKKQRISVYVKSNLSYEVWSIERVLIPNIGIKVGKWRTLGLYREWSAGADMTTMATKLQEQRWRKFILEWTKLRSKWVCVLGDVNICMADRETTSQHQRKLHEMRSLIEDEILARGWCQLVNKFTRTQKLSRGDNIVLQQSLLDHIYVREQDFVKDIMIKNHTGFDHSTVGCTLLAEKIPVKPDFIELRRVDDIEDGLFQEYYLRSNFHQIFDQEDPDEAVKLLEDIIVDILDRICPVKKIKFKSRFVPWMTYELLEMIELRDSVRIEAMNSKKAADWNYFKYLRREVSRELRSAKERYEAEYLDVADPKQQWARIMRMTGLEAREKSSLVLEVDGKRMDSPEETAEYMNQFFKTKVDRLIENLDPSVEEAINYMKEYLDNKRVGEFSFQEISYAQTSLIISQLRNTSSVGRDGIGVKIVKRFRDVLTPAIRFIINLSIRKKIFPDSWKYGVITCLPKKGCLLQPKNWRPINLLCILSKTLEMSMNFQWKSYMETWELLSPSQHAYRNFRGTTTAWIEVDSTIREAAERGWQSMLKRHLRVI